MASLSTALQSELNALRGHKIASRGGMQAVVLLCKDNREDVHEAMVLFCGSKPCHELHEAAQLNT